MGYSGIRKYVFEGRPGFPAFEDADGGEIPAYLQDINEKYIQTGNVIPEWNFYVMDLNALCESSLYVYYVDAPAKGDTEMGTMYWNNSRRILNSI